MLRQTSHTPHASLAAVLRRPLPPPPTPDPLPAGPSPRPAPSRRLQRLPRKGPRPLTSRHVLPGEGRRTNQPAATDADVRKALTESCAVPKRLGPVPKRLDPVRPPLASQASHAAVRAGRCAPRAALYSHSPWAAPPPPQRAPPRPSAAAGALRTMASAAKDHTYLAGHSLTHRSRAVRRALWRSAGGAAGAVARHGVAGRPIARIALLCPCPRTRGVEVQALDHVRVLPAQEHALAHAQQLQQSGALWPLTARGLMPQQGGGGRTSSPPKRIRRLMLSERLTPCRKRCDAERPRPLALARASSAHV
jgi:hypothetical protein